MLPRVTHAATNMEIKRRAADAPTATPADAVDYEQAIKELAEVEKEASEAGLSELQIQVARTRGQAQGLSKNP